MTDQTKCPHCGADLIARTLYRSVYQCGSRDLPDRFEQSTVCEVWQLRAKVAAQQTLLDDIRNSLYVQTFDTCPPGYAGIINEGMLRRLGVKLCDA